MVSMLDFGSSGLDLNPGQGPCVFGKRLYSHGTSLHTGVSMGTDKFNTGDSLVMG